MVRVRPVCSSGLDTPTSVSWECVVDGGLPSNISVSGAENNLRLCEQDGLSDAPHVLTVSVQATNGGIFWLDYVKYLPTASTPGLENAAISMDSTDPDLNFQGWTQFSPGFQVETSATGSKLSFNFIGNKNFMHGFIFSTNTYFIQEDPFSIMHILNRRLPWTQAQKRPAIQLTANRLFPSTFCPKPQHPALVPMPRTTTYYYLTREAFLQVLISSMSHT